MKKLKKLLLASTMLLSVMTLSGCIADYFEEEIKVVFVNEGNVVSSGVVTQFDNVRSPIISDAYVPEDFRFLGWTYYEYHELDLTNVDNFKSQYISAGRMVHYMDVRDAAENNTIVLNALIIHKDEIPREYHYAVVAWYDKPATSGVSAPQMDILYTNLLNYLASEGVSEEDRNTIVFRGYSGNVGPTTGQILYDGDVDIMFGWGSLENITTTGSLDEDMVLESQPYAVTYNGNIKNRFVHRLTDSEGALKVMSYILSEEARAVFN